MGSGLRAGSAYLSNAIGVGAQELSLQSSNPKPSHHSSGPDADGKLENAGGPGNLTCDDAEAPSPGARPLPRTCGRSNRGDRQAAAGSHHPAFSADAVPSVPAPTAGAISQRVILPCGIDHFHGALRSPRPELFRRLGTSAWRTGADCAF